MNKAFISAFAIFAIAAPFAAQAQVPQVLPIESRIQSEYQAGIENIQNNRDYRNGLLPRSSTTPVELPARLVPPLLRRFATSTAAAASSSSAIGAVSGDEGAQALPAPVFAVVQANLVQQLTQALVNLFQIRSRIALKIQVESADGSHAAAASSASSSLASADADSIAAKTAIKALASYVPAATSTDSLSDMDSITASTTIDISPARALGAAAIAAVEKVKGDLAAAVSVL